MSKPLPKTSGIETHLFAGQRRWMAYWLPYHWGFRGWGDSEEDAIADLKRRDPHKADEFARAAIAECSSDPNTRPDRHPSPTRAEMVEALRKLSSQLLDEAIACNTLASQSALIKGAEKLGEGNGLIRAHKAISAILTKADSESSRSLDGGP